MNKLVEIAVYLQEIVGKEMNLMELEGHIQEAGDREFDDPYDYVSLRDTIKNLDISYNINEDSGIVAKFEIVRIEEDLEWAEMEDVIIRVTEINYF